MKADSACGEVSSSMETVQGLTGDLDGHVGVGISSQLQRQRVQQECLETYHNTHTSYKDIS